MITNNSNVILTYALLSDAAYEHGLIPVGWTLIESKSSLSTGFSAIAVQNNETGEVVVAYRGTDGFDDATGTYSQLALQNDVPNQYPEALAFFTEINDSYGNVTLTGHSLGGALAQLVAATTSSITYTYNAPGVDGLRDDIFGEGSSELLNSASSYTNIQNFNMFFDAISTIGEQLGHVTNYDPASADGLLLAASFITTMVNPTLGTIVFGNSTLGQHYISTLETAIASSKPVDYIQDYTYNSEIKVWSTLDDDGVDVPADSATADTLNAQRDQNIQYNSIAADTKRWLTRYRAWQSVTKDWRESDEGPISIDFSDEFDNEGVLLNAQGEELAYFKITENEDGEEVVSVLDSFGNVEQSVNLDKGEIYGFGKFFNDIESGIKTLVSGIETYSPAIIDSLSTILAIKNGEPLPILSSGLKLANTLLNVENFELSGASNVVSGVVSVLSLNNAIEQGDNLAIASSSAQVVGYGAQAYADFAFNSLEGNLNAAFDAAELADSITGDVLPALNLISAIERGDNEAAAVALISYSVPVVGQVYAVYNLVSSIFADGPPDPWGTGQYVWDGSRNASGGSALSVSAAGESGGSQAVQNIMDAVVATLNSIIERERQQNPGAQLGLIPERMPTLGYGLSGFSYTNIDPLTGVEKNPGLRFDTSGNPINAEPGSPESFQSLIEGMVRSALSRGAIAPLWEVETANRQSDAGDPKAGLTEEARAGRDGQLAAVLTGATQSFRPVSLDLDGDGLESIIKENSNVYFDVDDSGYKKKTAWIGADDGLLTIDRNYNGNLDSGRELFSNGKVALGRRGLAGMGWVDANYDGKITSADPVWNEINVWQDANSDGVQDDGESQSLSDLGITELNYSLGTFIQNGVIANNRMSGARLCLH